MEEDIGHKKVEENIKCKKSNECKIQEEFEKKNA